MGTFLYHLVLGWSAWRLVSLPSELKKSDHNVCFLRLVSRRSRQIFPVLHCLNDFNSLSCTLCMCSNVQTSCISQTTSARKDNAGANSDLHNDGDEAFIFPIGHPHTPDQLRYSCLHLLSSSTPVHKLSHCFSRLHQYKISYSPQATIICHCRHVLHARLLLRKHMWYTRNNLALSHVTAVRQNKKRNLITVLVTSSAAQNELYLLV